METITESQLVDLPCGWKCKKEEREAALKVYYDAYDRYFDGFNYDQANAMADRALYAYMTK